MQSLSVNKLRNTYHRRIYVYKYDTDHNFKKMKDISLILENHLVNEESMDVRKLSELLLTLADSWNCRFMDLQIQARFVPQGTDKDKE